jgi:hypothetical protein
MLLEYQPEWLLFFSYAEDIQRYLEKVKSLEALGMRRQETVHDGGCYRYKDKYLKRGVGA